MAILLHEAMLDSYRAASYSGRVLLLKQCASGWRYSLKGGAMYGVLLLPFHGEPTLVTSFSSRREFLLAMSLEDSAGGWQTAGQYERAVYEIASAAEIEGILREVS